MINFGWTYFKWVLVLAAIAVVLAVPCLNQRVDEEIRCRVGELFAEHYAGLKVTVRKAELLDDGIEIQGLSIAEPAAKGPHAELVRFEEIHLSCSTDWQELIGGQPEVTHVIIRRPTIWLTRRPDGTWSAAKLFPLPKLSEHPPTVTIENGTIEIFDPLKTPSSSLTLRDVNLTLVPVDRAKDPQRGPHSRKVQGSFSADHLRRVEVEGWIDPQTQAWSFGGTVDRLDVSPHLRDALPGVAAEKMAALGDLRGQAALTFRVAYDPADATAWQYEVAGSIVRGRIEHPRLPHPLTGVRAAFRLDNQGITIDELVARSSQTSLRLSARQEGFLPESPKTIRVKIQQLKLDQALRDCLPEKKLRDQWQKYLPAGLVDVDATLHFDGKKWYPQGLVRCRNVSFTHEKFPYRLSEGTGTLQLTDDRLQLDLTAYSGSRPVQVNGEVFNLSSGPTGWTEIRGDDLPLDAKLLSALKEKPRGVVRSLKPSGTINFRVHLWRQQPGGVLHKDLVINLNRCSIRYDKFPYPLGNIRGTIAMRDDHWTFQGLEGTNDTGRITAGGHMTPPGPDQELSLRFVAGDVPLEEELRDALRPNIQRVWNDLKPRGNVDLVAEVKYLCSQKKLSVGVRARPQPETASIEPVHFPYRMERVEGLLIYEDGQVTLRHFRARHGPKHAPVKIAADGSFQFFPDGGWKFQLKGLSVDRMRLDGDLISAMPGRLKKAVLQLNPRGQIDLRGSFGLEGGSAPGGPVRSHWDLVLGLHQGTIENGIKLENIHGSITLRGGFDGRNFHSQGELDIDSLSFKDFQFTQLMGPLWIDDRQVLFGSWVAQRHNTIAPRDRQQQPRPLTAKLFGGTVHADLWVAPDAEPRYGLFATLSGAELASCAQEVMAGRQNLRGEIFANLNLAGTGRSVNGLVGSGKVQLRDADVYELPLMVALLKILSIRQPDTTAFSKSDVDFTIQGNHIYFKRIDFNGDAVSLLGQGEMDFQSNIALSFYSIVGRGELNLPIVKEIFTGASQQIMQIHIGGTLQNPVRRDELFPGVNQPLQQLQDELQSRSGRRGPLPEARRWFPDFGGRNRR